MIRINNGASNQMVSRTAPVDPSSLAIFWCGWVRVDSFSTGYVLHFDRTAATGFGMLFRVVAGGIVQALRSCGSSASWFGWEAASSFTASGTRVFVAVYYNGVSDGGASSVRVWTANPADLSPVERTVSVVNSGTPSVGTLDAMNGAWQLGNRTALDRAAGVMVGDLGIWTAAASTAAPTAMVTAAFNRTLPADQSPPAGWTLRAELLGHGDGTNMASLYDSAAGTDWTAAGSVTSLSGADALHGPALVSDGFPVTSGLVLRLKANNDTQRSRITSDSGNGNLRVRSMLDVSGSGRAAFQTTANNRPGFSADSLDSSTASRQGRVCHIAADSGQTDALSVSDPGVSVNDANVTVGAVLAPVVTDATKDFGTLAGVGLGTNSDGRLTITVSGTTYTPTGSPFIQSRMQPFIVTVGTPASGASTRTITVYSTEGTVTITTSSYTAAAGAFTRIGAAVGSTDRTKLFAWQEWAVWNTALSASDAASVLSWWRSTYNLPSAYTETVIGVGSSTFEGWGTWAPNTLDALGPKESDLGHFGPQLAARRPTARVFLHGRGGSATADRYIRGTMNAGTIPTVGTLATQAVSGATGTVVGTLSNGSGASWLALRDTSGTFDTSNQINFGGGFTATFSPSQIVTPSASGAWNASRRTLLNTLAAAHNSQPISVLLYTSSNASNSGVVAAIEVPTLNNLIAEIKTSNPTAKVYPITTFPRMDASGSASQPNGTLFTDFNTLLRSTAGQRDALIDMAADLRFDWLDDTLVADNGVYDAVGSVVFTDTWRHADNVHLNSRGHALMVGFVVSVLFPSNRRSGGRAGRAFRANRARARA